MTVDKTLEQVFGNALEEYVKSASFEEMMHKHMAAAFESSFKENLDGWNAPAKKIIEEKMKAMIIPAIESYDFNRFETKLIAALDEMVKLNMGPTAKIMDNFRELIKPTPEYIKVTDIFDKYGEIYEQEMDTEDVDVIVEDGVYYESAEIGFTFYEDEEGRNHYGSRHYASLDFFIQEHPSSDENVVEREREKHHLKFRLWQPRRDAQDDFWEKYYVKDCEAAGANYNKRDLWYISNFEDPNLFHSLRHAEVTKIMAFNLVQHSKGIIIDSTEETCDITSSSEPEADFR